MAHLSGIDLDEAIYQKYIVPTKRKRKAYVGVEFELPIVNLKREPVDFSVIHGLTASFIQEFSFDIYQRDDSGNIYSATSSENDDTLSYDCSYNTLELSFGRENDLNIIHERFVKYYSYIQDYLKPHEHTLTGMGVNPHFDINTNEPIPNGRYRMLLHHLSSYKKYKGVVLFHQFPNFGLFSCASQVQLDVEEEDVPQILNTFSKIEPIKAILFANSLWADGELLCGRDMFWRNSMHGYNRHNVDMYDVEFHSTGEIVSYIKSMSIYCIERDGLYINFAPTPLEEYFASEKIEGEYFDGEGYSKIVFEPRIEDLQYLRSFKMEDLTLRGTVEFRSMCEQPVRDIMCPAAFQAGLVENLSALTKLIESDTIIYQKGYSPSELRDIFNHRKWPDFIDREEIKKLVISILDIARDGLIKRNLGEEHFIDVLYERAGTLQNPARVMADGIDAGISLEHYIKDYAVL